MSSKTQTTATVADLIGDTPWLYFKRAGAWQSRSAGYTTEPVDGQYLAFTYQFRGRKVLAHSTHATEDEAQEAARAVSRELRSERPQPKPIPWSVSDATDKRVFGDVTRHLLIASADEEHMYLAVVRPWSSMPQSEWCIHGNAEGFPSEMVGVDGTNGWDLLKVTTPTWTGICEWCAEEYRFATPDAEEETLCEQCEVWGGDLWVATFLTFTQREWDWRIENERWFEDDLTDSDQVQYAAPTMKAAQELVFAAMTAREDEIGGTS
jgi:hypothetical protein